MEDQGLIFARVSAAEGTGIERMKKEIEKLEEPALKLVETGEISRLMVTVPGWGGTGTNSGMMIISLSPWQERERKTVEIAQALTEEWQHVPSLRAFAFSRSGLSRGGGDQPVQFVLGGPEYDVLAEWRDIILDRVSLNFADARFGINLDFANVAAVGKCWCFRGEVFAAVQAAFDIFGSFRIVE